MNDPFTELFDEFRQDHKMMGHGLFDIAAALRGEDDQKAAEAARALDQIAGPHIRFEELYFYPELRAFFGHPTVDRFEAEHQEGLAAIRRLTGMEGNASLSDEERSEILSQIETMRNHTDECGEHFGALGRISKKQQERLLSDLRRLRFEKGLWTQWSKNQQSA